MGLKNTSVFPTVLLLRWVKNTACEEVLAGVNLCRVGLHGLSVLSIILAIMLASPIFHKSFRKRPVYGDLFKNPEASTWVHSLLQLTTNRLPVSLSGSSS